MAEKGEERLKVVMGVTTNLLGTINKVSREDEEDVTPSASPRQSDSLPPHGSVTASHEKGASTSMKEEGPPVVKKLLEAWMTSPLSSILGKPAQGASRNTARVDTLIAVNVQHAPPLTGNTHTAVDAVYALEKLAPKVKWLQKMKLDPNTRKSNALCEFHQERGHKTKDCIDLQQEVANMLNQGHLKELMSDRGRANFARGRESHQGPLKPPSPACTIQMNNGGGGEATINHVKFITTHKLKQTITHERYDDLEDSIIFDKLDTHSLTFPYFDDLIITLRISDSNVTRIMVDDGSGACIIHPRVLTQMRLEDKIVPRCITLTCFNNAVERTFEEITLPVLAGGVILETTFHNQDTAYNAIIGRPWIHAMRAFLFSLYQVIKFPTP
uniref:Uncharacterized protein LOC104220630 n=1 Tax=Nicotiana sylvestris TaxID=4096 RepID=A0A1U7W6E3_NICSY|nr:PREDICTED: uncharacterized protein LOC104220630 [Nicotiana sylvestris]